MCPVERRVQRIGYATLTRQSFPFLSFVLDPQRTIWYNTHMEKRKQRTPQELIAEQQAKLERMQLRQAQVSAKSNPALSPLMDEKADLTKQIREAKKLLGDGPQSAVARIEKHEVWIGKIQTEANDAEIILASAESRLADLNSEITQAIQTVLSSPDSEKEIAAEG